MNISPLNFGSYKTEVVELRGGINENVSSLEMKPGELLECRNYMIAEGGYGGYISTKGYEQFDGAVVPSLVVSYIARLVEWTPGAIVVSDTLTSDTTAEVFTVVGVHEDTWELELTTPTATPTTTTDDTFNTGAYTLFAPLRPLIGGNVDYHAALDEAYDDVLEVPGEGPVLATYVFNGVVYAFRKTVGVNTIKCYKEHSTTGWTEVTQAVPLVYNSGGHTFRFTEYTFYAASTSKKFYFSDTRNKARECNGTTLVEVSMSDPSVGIDTPINIKAINDRLYLAYTGGYLVGSTIGDPLDYTTAPVLLTMGSEITNLAVGVGSTLVAILDKGIKIVHGYDEDSIEVQTFSDETGGLPNTAKRLLGTIFFVSDRGLTTMEAAEAFGEFTANSISQRFKRFLRENKGELIGAITSRDLNQYRLFYSNGKSIYVSFEGKEFSGATPMQFLIPVRTLAQGVDTDGNELNLFTSDDGHVYRMDSGKSFNGQPITTRMVTAFYHYKAPRNDKRFKRATVEIDGENEQEIFIQCNYDYKEPTQPKTSYFSEELYKNLGGAIWGEGVWGTMIYGSGTVTNRVPYYIEGLGINLSYTILSREIYRDQHIIQNIITDYQLCARRT